MVKSQPTNQQLYDLLLQVKNKTDDLDERVTKMDDRITTMDERITTMDDRITTMGERITTMDERITTMGDQITWLVGEYKNLDEEKTVGAYRQSEHTDEIERLKARTGRIERKLQLPVMQFNF